jgi:hypothetical protein
LIIQKRQNSVALASMSDWWTNWITAITALKLPLIDTAAIASPLAEAVADPENAQSAHKGRDIIINQLSIRPGRPAGDGPVEHEVANRKCG